MDGCDYGAHLDFHLDASNESLSMARREAAEIGSIPFRLTPKISCINI